MKITYETLIFFYVLLVSLGFTSASWGKLGLHAPADPRSSSTEQADNKGSPGANPPTLRKTDYTEAQWRRYIEGHQSWPAYLANKALGDERQINWIREGHSLPESAQKTMLKECSEGSAGVRINCLRQAVQKHFKDPKNFAEGCTGADCKDHSLALEAVLRETFRNSNAIKVKLMKYSNHLLLELTYRDHDSQKEYVYAIDTNNDKGKTTDLRPVNQTAINEPVPAILLQGWPKNDKRIVRPILGNN